MKRNGKRRGEGYIISQWQAAEKGAEVGYFQFRTDHASLY